MRRMRIVLTLLLSLLALPLFGQGRELSITPWASAAQLQGENAFANGVTTDFDDGSGFGLSVNAPVARLFSVEGSLFDLRNRAGLLVDGNTDFPIGLGRVRLTPVTVGVQFHPLGASRIDPYVGAGGAYVMARDLQSPDLDFAGLGRIELDDAFTYYLNAGVGVEVGRGFGIVLDGRLIPYETTSRSTATGVERDFEISPRLLSLGLRFRF